MLTTFFSEKMHFFLARDKVDTNKQMFQWMSCQMYAIKFKRELPSFNFVNATKNILKPLLFLILFWTFLCAAPLERAELNNLLLPAASLQGFQQCHYLNTMKSIISLLAATATLSFQKAHNHLPSHRDQDLAQGPWARS